MARLWRWDGERTGRAERFHRERRDGAAVSFPDATPTNQDVSTFRDLNNALDQQLARWDEIKTKDVPELNLKLKRSGLPQLNPELATAAGDLRGNHDRAGDDEP